MFSDIFVPLHTPFTPIPSLLNPATLHLSSSVTFHHLTLLHIGPQGFGPKGEILSCTISLLQHFVLLFHSIPQATYIRYLPIVSIPALICTLVITDLIQVISNTALDLAIVFIVL